MNHTLSSEPAGWSAPARGGWGPLRPWLISLPVLLLLLALVWSWDFRLVWQVRDVVLEVKAPQALLITLVGDTGQGFDQEGVLATAYDPRPEEHKVLTFLLPPGKHFRSLRLDLGEQTGQLEIKSVSFRSLIEDTRFSNQGLQDLFLPLAGAGGSSVIQGNLRINGAHGRARLDMNHSAADRVFGPRRRVLKLRLFWTAVCLFAATLVFLSLRYPAGQPGPGGLSGKQFAALASLSALFGLACFYFLRRVDFDFFDTRCKATITLQTSQEDRHYFFYDTGRDFNVREFQSLDVRGLDTFQNLAFQMPGRRLPENIRFDPGDRPGRILIRSITLETAYKKFTWSARECAALFQPISDIRDFRVENGLLLVQVSGPDPYFVGKPAVREQLAALRQLRRRLTQGFVLFLSLLAACFAFFVLRASRSLLDRVAAATPDQLWLSSLFLFFLFLPLTNPVLRFANDISSTELRALAEKPRLTFSDLFSFPRKFTSYFNDNFPFRNLLVRWDSLFRVNWLRTSPSFLIAVGKKGWWFLRSEVLEEGNGLNAQLGLFPFSATDLDYIRSQMLQQARWFADRRIKFYFVVCPFKESIYPEYLPYAPKLAGPISRTDQYLAALATLPGLAVVDLRQPLLAAKSQQVLFYQKDVHWNLYGGFIAYQALFRELAKDFPGAQPLTGEDVKVTQARVRQFGGGFGLVGMLNVSGVYEDTELKVDIVRPRPPAFPRVLVLHDSMFNAIEPFFKTACSEFIYVHHDWRSASNHYAAIEATKPDVVIYEISEQRLSLPGKKE